MTNASRLDATTSFSGKMRKDSADTDLCKVDSARNTPASSFGFHSSGGTRREPRSDDGVNGMQDPAYPNTSAPSLLQPTKGTDVYIPMRADGTYYNTTSGIVFLPSFFASSDQVSFDASLADWISGSREETKAGKFAFLKKAFE
ncbi:hypothetical protein M413DRAFT_13592 [Hebeloma cylindrosporum]|uniref:Uncharacterized protein n=1 Tax=Hebeloma cylindrosporum TaxID=76867 RepID=A0A0C2XGK5_HEBCY|nr:hypothetical protein M413DRAFT_13592 [Hebeloma cylindrosporum h7]